MSSVCVIIPIYTTHLTSDEELSFRQTLRVLGHHSISLVCPDALDISYYTHFANEMGVRLGAERFPNVYFQGVPGYNRLLLSPFFYERFSAYNYILICQTDAYVFRDELDKWCEKGYDYIGAPLVGNYRDEVFSTRMRVGNGGFSLRRISSFLSFFNSRKNVFSGPQLIRRINLWGKPYTRILVWLMMVLGWRNSPSVVADRWKYNEDDFWSGLLNGTRYQLRTPEIAEAIRFSFERFPSELYEMNHHQLPFGCHAWRKYQYESFWSKYID